MESLLWCEEEMEGSPQAYHGVGKEEYSSSPLSFSSSSSACTHADETSWRWNVRCNSGYGTFEGATDDGEQHDDVSIAGLLRRQTEFQHGSSYPSKLQSRQDFSSARCLATRWIVKAQMAFHFSPVTAALAVNYLDRYLEKSLSLSWKSWMIELLTVTCLSLAAKMEEVEVPALLDLQGCDGLEHAFEAKTVQRMELNVLSALGWRLNSITPFSFAEKAINCFCIRHYLKNALMLRTSELLVSILQVPAFLEFEPSVIAVSSICFALEELIPSQVDQLKSYLFQLIPLEPESAKRCYVQMESLVVDPICTTTEEGSTKSPLSPNTVSYNEGADDSEGTSSYVASAVFLERIPLEDIILYPKRQRIC